MDRWLYIRYRRNLHRPMRPRPPRARSVELPYLWAAHLWCWMIIGIQRAKTRRGDERRQVRVEAPEDT